MQKRYGLLFREVIEDIMSKELDPASLLVMIDWQSQILEVYNQEEKLIYHQSMNAVLLDMLKSIGLTWIDNARQEIFAASLDGKPEMHPNEIWENVKKMSIADIIKYQQQQKKQ